MTASQRRQQILNVLIERQHVTARNLAEMFQVSVRTIMSDVEALTCEYPIETVRGADGGIRLASWFRPTRSYLAREQINAILKAAPFLEGSDQQALLSILNQFSAP